MVFAGSATPTPTPPHKGEGLAAIVARHGLITRGVASHGSKSVILIGHAGSSIWPHFTTWLKAQDTVPADPLDAWSKEIVGAAAAAVGGHAVFPSDQPYHPFQQWAMQATGLKPSPLGILIHPVYGLWHAYRGAILFDDLTLSHGVEKLSHPCDTCVEKPCLSACPANAFSDVGFAVASCRAYLESIEGRHCMDNGCAARGACPVGRDYAYIPEQVRFHMRAVAK